MAKCPVCNTRKGKRKCGIVNNDFVCSLCCANTRKEELCLNCVFYQPLQHDYEKAPAFSIAVLIHNHALQSYQQRIEKALNSNTAQDSLAMIELLMDKYHFKDAEIKITHPLWQSGFEAANHLIINELQGLDEDILTNLLGAMRLAIKEKIPQE